MQKGEVMWSWWMLKVQATSRKVWSRMLVAFVGSPYMGLQNSSDVYTLKVILCLGREQPPQQSMVGRSLHLWDRLCRRCLSSSNYLPVLSSCSRKRIEVDSPVEEVLTYTKIIALYSKFWLSIKLKWKRRPQITCNCSDAKGSLLHLHMANENRRCSQSPHTRTDIIT